MEHTGSESLEIAPPQRIASPRLSTINRYLSLAAVLAIVIGLAGTAWIYQDRRGGHRNNNLALVATPESTPNSIIIFTYDLPAAGDCTVDPLTDDQVVAKLSEQDRAFNQIFTNGTQSATNVTFDDLVAAQHLYVACIMYGSINQIAALETNRYFSSKRMTATIPFISPSTMIADLRSELLTQKPRLEPAFSNWGAPSDTFLPSIVDQPELQAFSVDDPYRANMTIFWQEQDNPGFTIEDLGTGERTEIATVMEQLPWTWTFVQDYETGLWLLDSVDQVHDVWGQWFE